MTDALNSASRADALVLFGATGDLAFKKIFPALQSMAQLGQLDMPVVVVTREGRSKETMLARARESVQTYGGGADDAALSVLGRQLQVVSGDYADAATYRALATALRPQVRPLFYLAIPPSAYAGVVNGLGAAGCARGGRVLIEKPFGHDLASARELNGAIRRVFDEASIYRLDHYAGKRSVQNIALFRFASAYAEGFWNRSFVSCVKVTMAESFGVAGRGRFYEEAGAIRDVVQNHLLQVVTLVAMEPPVGVDADALRDERAKVLKAMDAVDPSHVVRGQYRGYRNEQGVAPDSDVETFAALRLSIESWRWAGVPFYVRAGKNLAASATEVVVEFKPPPRLLFAAPGSRPHPNHMRFCLGPDEAVSFTLDVKALGEELVSRPADFSSTAEAFGTGRAADPYERLIEDALEGDARRFAREDSVEEAWRVVEPVLEHPTPVVPYEPGSWGPPEADRIVEGDDRWHSPAR